MLIVAVALSAIAAFYSIAGLMAIFAAAVIPIAIMGTILETAKVTVTLWLHEYWRDAKLLMKSYLCVAVFILMLLTSMGIFGFLSKAHLDQAVPSGAVSDQVTMIDEKIQTQKDNIDSARRALTQMDQQVDQMLGRTTDDRGAERSNQIRKAQARERAALQNDIAKAQKEITRLKEERAPIAKELRKVEAEVGPIKYIAALIYNDKPDETMLERAVRWVIICIVIVFDPLAIMMLLAATESMSWIKRERLEHVVAPIAAATVESSDDPPVVIGEEPVISPPEISVQSDLPNGSPSSPDSDDTMPPPLDIEGVKPLAMNPSLDDAAAMNIRPPEEIPGLIVRPWTDDEIAAFDKAHAKAKEGPPTYVEFPEVTAKALDQEERDEDKEAMRQWKAEHPETTIKEQRRLLERGMISQLPWQQGLEADNEPNSGKMRGFGIAFPTDAIKGDQFLRVDALPSVLYKFNGNKWIQVDKAISDQYAFDTAYIDHLINKIESGEYDPDLLNDVEREQIAIRLKQQT